MTCGASSRARGISFAKEFYQHQNHVSAYYTSNVEEFLFGDEVFNAFVENVKRLPVDERSVFIRAMRTSGSHPAHVPGHRMTTVLQKIQVFLKDYDLGLLPDYRSLVGTDYIAGNQP